MTRRQWIGFILFAGLLAYLPSLRGGFVWDDDMHVVNNWMLRSWDGLRLLWFKPGAVQQFYPLSYSGFALQYSLWELNPLGYRIVNLILHLSNALLIGLILQRFKLRSAWLAAFLFALHPVHVESVAWITEFKNVFSTFFYLVSAFFYLRFIEEGSSPTRWRLYALSLGVFVLALLSKTVTCSLPAALLLLFWWKKGKLTSKDWTPLIPFFMLGLLTGLYTAWIEAHLFGAKGPEWTFTLAERFLIAGRSAWIYVGKILFPYPLMFFYPLWQLRPPSPFTLLAPIAVIALLGVLIWRRRVWGRGPLVAFLFFGGTALPALGFINLFTMRYSYVADHFQYVASIGLIALVTEGLWRLMDMGKWLRFSLMLILPLILIVRVRAETRKFMSLQALWEDTLAKNYSSQIAHDNYAALLMQQGHVDQALSHLQKAVELNPRIPQTQYNYANALARAGHFEKALEHYYASIAIEDKHPQVYNNLGMTYVSLKRYPEAIEAFEKGLLLAPDAAPIRANLQDAKRRSR